MNHKTFFDRFGDTVLWQRGQVGQNGFTIEELYQAFEERVGYEIAKVIKGVAEKAIEQQGHSV